jgi:Iron-sulfur cluster assembly protein
MTSDVVIDALREVYDPCCADREISIVDMGIVEDVRVDGGHVDVKVVWDPVWTGGEAPIWHPQWALEDFWNFELPRDIVEERGYPQLTEQAKRKILGGNLARLHGMEVPA